MRRALVGALAAGLALAGSATAQAADPILPLSEVHSGMVGEARTVVRGTDIVTFPVTVIDVERSDDGPGGSQILVRAGGPLIEQTGGVAEGMSGSPVYVTGADGVARVIGAIAYGTGDQANVIVALTPIEQMIDSSSGLRANAIAIPRAASRRTVIVRTRAAARALEARDPSRRGLYPLTRWTVAGVPRPLVGGLARSLAAKGIQLTSIGPRSTRPVVPFVPGASLSVFLAGGDFSLAATGTVTYVDGSTILGFGHPFLGGGPTRLLMGDAYVLQTIAAPITGSSQKIADPGNLQGMIIGDRADGVTGRIGPVEGIAGVATATDAARGTESTVRVTLAPDERTAPLVGGILQDAPALRVRDGVGGGTLTLEIAITSPDLPHPIMYRNVYAAAGDVVSLSSGQLQRLMSILLQNGVRPVPISAITVTERLEPRVRAARILGAAILRKRVRPGGKATLALRVQPWRASPRVIRVGVTLPDGLGQGSSHLTVIPNADGGFDPFPADLSQELGAAVPFGSRSRAVARAEGFARRATGTRLSRIVAGVRRASDDRHDAIRILTDDEDAGDPRAGITVPVPYVISGGRAGLRVRVR